MMNPHLKTLAAGTLALAAFAVTSFAQPIASDNAGNYLGDWTNGSNSGTGFGAWNITSGDGTGGFGGAFLGDPAGALITGMTNPSFALFANPSGSGAFASVKRAFAAPLNVGETFSFQWGINFDSGATGNKGFNIFTGGIAGSSIANVNNGGSAAITINGTDTGFIYGTQAMDWSFTYSSPTTVDVFATARNGGASYSTILTVAGAPDAFEFYATDMQGGNEAQPYFNNLTVVPEPSTYALLGLGAASILWRIRRRKTS